MCLEDASSSQIGQLVGIKYAIWSKPLTVP